MRDDESQTFHTMNFQSLLNSSITFIYKSISYFGLSFLVKSHLLLALDVVVVDLPDEGLVLVDAQLLEERLSHLRQQDVLFGDISHFLKYFRLFK